MQYNFYVQFFYCYSNKEHFSPRRSDFWRAVSRSSYALRLCTNYTHCARPLLISVNQGKKTRLLKPTSQRAERSQPNTSESPFLSFLPRQTFAVLFFLTLFLISAPLSYEGLVPLISCQRYAALGTLGRISPMTPLYCQTLTGPSCLLFSFDSTMFIWGNFIHYVMMS